MMSSIEGVGGEVIQFFFFLGVIFICFLLWLTTRVRSADEPFFSTVYVLERRYGRNQLGGISNRLTGPSDRSTEDEHADPLSSDVTNVEFSSSSNGETRENVSAVDKNRSSSESFGRNGNIKNDFQEGCSSTSSMSGFQATCSKDSLTESECTHDSEVVSNQSESNIKVRLKYLNDDSREVDGLLHERLSDFKRRNFPDEITANKIIRLIFNGRVLRDDSVSLQNCGLFNDCVVHCLIVNEKPQQPSNPEQSEQSQHFHQNNEQTSVPEWNLNKLLCFIVVGILSLTWYCRFQFAALFTFTSTSFLLGLTIIFLCSMFGSFYVDTIPIN